MSGWKFPVFFTLVVCYIKARDTSEAVGDQSDSEEMVSLPSQVLFTCGLCSEQYRSYDEMIAHHSEKHPAYYPGWLFGLYWDESLGSLSPDLEDQCFFSYKKVEKLKSLKVETDNYTGTLSGSVKRSSSLTVKFYAKLRGMEHCLSVVFQVQLCVWPTQFGLWDHPLQFKLLQHAHCCVSGGV